MIMTIGNLQEAMRIAASVHAQDEIDREQTVLYGINEEMGNKEI